MAQSNSWRGVEPTVTIQDLTEPSERGESSSADVSLPTMPVSAEISWTMYNKSSSAWASVGLQLGYKITSMDTKTLL